MKFTCSVTSIRFPASWSFPSNFDFTFHQTLNANEFRSWIAERNIIYLVAYLNFLSSYHKKAIKALQRSHLGVTGHLSTAPRWGNLAKGLYQQHNE